MTAADIEIIRYNPEYKELWNDFVESSKNGTFLFNRDYMDYHSDRFPDYSFIVMKKQRPYCLFPACRQNDIVSSHNGLTYGGLIMSAECTAGKIFEIFGLLLQIFKKEDCKSLIYKPVPYIYTSLPSEEDLYALFRYKAILKSRVISSTIRLDNRVPFSRGRMDNLRKAKKENIKVVSSSDFSSFWHILEENLKNKYEVKPVHTLEEMKKLSSLFPDNIKLFIAKKNSETVGGVLCYIMKDVIHSQYISAGMEGKKMGAIDAIIDHIINQECKDFRYFDFGSSCEDGGAYLNESLIFQKEGFGGRGVCYDSYIIDLV